MADVVINPADVSVTTPSGSQRSTSSAAMVAGQIIYPDTNTTVALANAGAVDTAAAVGMLLNDATAAGQPVSYARSGDIVTVSSVLTVGEVYVPSVTDGGLAPVVDLLTGNFTTVFAVAIAANQLKIGIVVGGVAKV